MTSAQHPTLVRSIRSLARHVGKAESTVRKWIRREDWPFALLPPWNVERVRVWAEIQISRDPAAAYRKRIAASQAGTGEYASLGPLGKARLQAVIERALLLRQRRLIEAGQMHDVRQCQERRARAIHEAKGRFAELPRSIAQSLAGQDAATVEDRLRCGIAAILDDFAAGYTWREREGMAT